MAGVFVSLVLDAVRHCDPSQKLTLVALADRANLTAGGRAWPSLGDIAARTDRSTRQVRTDMRALESLGWIAAEGSRRGGRGRTTTYRIALGRMIECLPPEKAEAHFRVLQQAGALKAEVQSTKAEVQRPKGGSAASERRKPTSAEPLEPKGTGIEPRTPATEATPSVESQNRLIENLTRQKQPRTRPPALLNQAEQVEYADPGTGEARRKALLELRAERLRAWDVEAPAAANGGKP